MMRRRSRTSQSPRTARFRRRRPYPCSPMGSLRQSFRHSRRRGHCRPPSQSLWERPNRPSDPPARPCCRRRFPWRCTDPRPRRTPAPCSTRARLRRSVRRSHRRARYRPLLWKTPAPRCTPWGRPECPRCRRRSRSLRRSPCRAYTACPCSPTRRPRRSGRRSRRRVHCRPRPGSIPAVWSRPSRYLTTTRRTASLRPRRSSQSQRSTRSPCRPRARSRRLHRRSRCPARRTPRPLSDLPQRSTSSPRPEPQRRRAARQHVDKPPVRQGRPSPCSTTARLRRRRHRSRHRGRCRPPPHRRPGPRRRPPGPERQRGYNERPQP